MRTKKHLRRIEDAIAEQKPSITDAMLEAMLDCESPASVAFYLRAYPEIATKIAAMPQGRQTREIERIDEAWTRMDEKFYDRAERRYDLVHDTYY